MLSNLRTALNDVGCVLVMADAPVGVLEDIASHSFPDVDAALEWCEDRILDRLGTAAESLPEDLGIQELLGGLTPAELALVESGGRDGARDARATSCSARATTPTPSSSCCRAS